MIFHLLSCTTVNKSSDNVMNVTKRVTSHAYKHTLTVPLTPDIPLHSFAFRPIRLNSSLNRSYANYYYVDL